ncbi:hypothetical protein CAF53_25890 (plasmid) [Sphingobium sp. LB126]|uniref:MFS transporter n=1 Tax=Sphingobium sp. LB126 TaxID=1983755 RepID=UPI000C20926E|nr:MFS transporter [Sphingobium sp. LB126]PJG45054.1 hypothetical protein CAF53_25890 [Sphingobium sp. LB126]
MLHTSSDTALDSAAQGPETLTIGHWVFLSLCFVIMMFDGFDVQVIGPTAPFMAKSHGIAISTFGLVLGAGHLGAIVGAFGLGLIADRTGRKRTLVVATIVFGVATIAIVLPFISSVSALAGVRFVSGIALGGIAPIVLAMAAQVTPQRIHGRVLATLWLGLPAGGVACGLLGALTLPDWKSLYMIGGLPPTLIAILLIWLVPPSQSLAASSAPAPARVQAPALAAAAPRPRVLAPGRRASTLILWILFFVEFVQMIFVVSWSPTLLDLAGASPSQVGSALLLFNLGSMTGITVGGVLVDRISHYRVMIGCSVAIMLSLFLLGMFTHYPFAFFAIGLVLFGASSGVGNSAVLALAAAAYPPDIRATAIGWAYCFARLGSTVAASLGGYLYAAGWSAASLYYLIGSLGIALLLGAMLIARFVRPSAQGAGERLEHGG